MSAVRVEIKDLGNGFSRVLCDGKSCGIIENAEGDLSSVITNLLEALDVENVIVLNTK